MCSPQRPATPLPDFFWPELDEFDVDEGRHGHSFGRGHEINHLRVDPFLTDHDAVYTTSACQLRVLAEPHPPFVACADTGVMDVAESWQSRSVTPAISTPVLASPPVDEPLPPGDGVASVSSDFTDSNATTCLAHCTLGGQPAPIGDSGELDGPTLVERPLSPETDCSWAPRTRDADADSSRSLAMQRFDSYDSNVFQLEEPIDETPVLGMEGKPLSLDTDWAPQKCDAGDRSVAMQRFDSYDSDVSQLDEPTDEMPVLGMEGIAPGIVAYHARASGSGSHAHVATAHQGHSQEQPASCNLNTIHSHTVSRAPCDRAGPPPRSQRFVHRGDARTAPVVEAEKRSTKRKRNVQKRCETETAVPLSNDSTSPPHSKRITGRHQLEDSFHLSREEAAARLGCGITHFKQQCRAFGVKKWPRRQVIALMQAQARLEEHQKSLRPVCCARTEEALKQVSVWQRQVRQPNM